MSGYSTPVPGSYCPPINPTPIALLGVPVATVQIWLGLAQQALQDLMTGAKPSTVTYAQGDGSRSVTYTRANMADLRAWIMQLQQAANPGTNIGRRRAIGVCF